MTLKSDTTLKAADGGLFPGGLSKVEAASGALGGTLCIFLSVGRGSWVDAGEAV